MTIESAAPSRRALLAGAVGAVVASVATAFGRPRPAAATHAGYIQLGHFPGSGVNEAVGTTHVKTTGGSGLMVESTVTNETGVVGYSSSTGFGIGTSGLSDGVGGWGLFGQAAGSGGTIAVRAKNDSADAAAMGLFATVANGRGVSGHSETRTGTHGDSLGSGLSAVGVHGEAYSGIGVAGWSHHLIGTLGQSSTGIGVVGQVGDVTNSPNGGIGVFGRSGLNSGVAGLTSNTQGAAGTYGYSSAPNGRGVEGLVASPTGTTIGVLGKSTSTTGVGVTGHSWASSTGVFGYSSTGDGLLVPPAKTGVYGRATQDANARGVFGLSSSGQGVRGQVSTGTALYGQASDPAGYALKLSGKVSFGKVSGVVVLAANTTLISFPVTTDVTSSSYVLLTPQGDPGSRRLWATKNATTNEITIRTNASAASPLSIAWLLIL